VMVGLLLLCVGWWWWLVCCGFCVGEGGFVFVMCGVVMVVGLLWFLWW